MSGRRAAFKVAMKNARRNRKRTLFLVLLVAVPVAFGLVVAGIVRASSLTQEEQAQTNFGSAEARIDFYATDPAVVDWIHTNLEIISPNTHLTEFHQTGMRVPGAGYAQVSDFDLRDPAVEGLMLLLRGRAPEAMGEVAISPTLAEELEVGVGDSVELENLPLGRLQVVGFVSQPFYNQTSDVLVHPGSLASSVDDPVSTAGTTVLLSGPDAEAASRQLVDLWYQEGQQLFWPKPAVDPPPTELEFLSEDPYVFLLLTETEIGELVELVRQSEGTPEDAMQAVYETANQMVYGNGEYRSLPDIQAQTRSEWLSWQSFETKPGVVSTGASALLLVEVAFVTGAAFAAGTRRRLREIGLMGANGASEKHVKATVLGEGLTIGSVGALTGVVLGIGFLVLARPLLQRFVSRVIVGIGIGPLDIIGPVAVALISVLLAVAIPARTASKVPTTTALQGRMPALSPRRWVVPVGIGASAAGFLLISVSLVSDSNLSSVLVGVGAVMVVGGVAMLASPILAVVTRLSDHVPATSRLVLRDSGRNRTRSAVAVAAIMVILLAPITAMTTAATSTEKNLVFGLPSPADHMVVTGSYANVYYGNAAPITEADVAALAAVLPEKQVAVFDTLDLRVLTNENLDVMEAAGPDGGFASIGNFLDGNAVAVGSDDLLLALNEAGVTSSIEHDEIVVLGIEDKATRVRINEVEYPAHEYPVPVVQWAMPRILIPRSMVADFPDAESKPVALFILERNPTDDEWQQTYDLGLQTNGGHGSTSESTIYLMAGGLTLLVVLIVIALVTAVSAAEVDQELRTIVAVGAPGSIRRRFLGLLTGYQTLVAMALAVPLGLGLVWVFSSTQQYFWDGPFGRVQASLVAVPWVWILAFALILPLAVGLLTMASVRSAPVTPPRRAT